MSRAFRLLFLLLILPFTWGHASAQVAVGVPQFGSFDGGPDTVNTGNLNVELKIPVRHKAGRGTDFSYDLVYDSSVWVSGSSWLLVPSTSIPGWQGLNNAGQSFISYSSSYSSNDITCNGVTHYTWQIWSYGGFYFADNYGVRHNYSVYWTYISNPAPCGPANGFSPSSSTQSQIAPDGSGFTITVTPTANGTNPTPTINSADGTAIVAPILPNGSSTTSSTTDRNGNQITSSNGVYTDTLGQTALSVTGSAPSSTNLSYAAPSGAQATYVVSYKTYTVRTNFGCSGITEYNTSRTSQKSLVDKVTLPDGSFYQFNYETTYQDSHTPHDVTGRIASVQLPTGGTISYIYDTGTTGINGISCSDGSAKALVRQTPDGKWTHTRTQISGNHWQTKITDPLLNDTVIDFQKDSASFSPPSQNTNNFYETLRLTYSGSSASGTLLQTATTCYNTNTINCATTAVSSPITNQTVTRQFGSNGLQDKEVYNYDSYGNSTEEDDYDYGSGAPGSLLKKTSTTYASLTGIYSFPQQVVVTNSGGTTVSKTYYNYGDTVTATSGTPQHTSPSGSRGNLLSVNYYTQGSTYLSKSYTYYDTGNVSVATDLNGAQTTYTYGACGNSFPTAVAEPLSMSRSMTWNCAGAVVTQLTDENSNNTTTVYNDPYFWRPEELDVPDGGKTGYTYNSETSTTTTQKMNSSQNIVTTVLRDGLGRTNHHQLNSDPLGTVYVDTTYDALGRISTVSNPYRSTSDPTYGITTTYYDALGRTTQVVPPDGTQSSDNVSYSYSDNCTTTKDQASKSRKNCVNGLGQQTQVFEDPSGSNYETDYTYDPLGNLLTVNQKGGSSNSSNWRTRTFAYDLLSRLTSATTPEAGTVSYIYDANGYSGDLTSRVAPAPNQTGSTTVTTTYTYDALNRLTGKTYSDTNTPAPTPRVQFLYDEARDWVALTNTIGRLSTTYVGTNNTPTVAGTEYSYDPMGRPTLYAQCDPSNCGSNAYWTNYTYDLAGDMTSASNGFGITISYGYDSAGRPSTVTSSSQNPVTLATVDPSAGYYPFGGLRKLTFGNGLVQTGAYNTTLEPCRINLNSSSTILGTCNDAIPSGNILDLSAGFNASTANNGNVTSVAATSQQTLNSFNRSFTYDSFNRISTMADSGSGACKGLSWYYDAWGNRTDQNNTGGLCPTFHAGAVLSNNRFGSPYQYDAAGNMTYDGNHNYFYDAENRLIQIDGTLGTCSTAWMCYVYDANGLRVRSSTSQSSGSEWIHDLQGHVVSQSIIGVGWGRGYVYLGSQQIAEYGDGTTYFIHPDHLGSSRLMSKPDQSICGTLDYLPFGDLSALGSCTTVHRFTGDEWDTETGQDHAEFRQYSAAQGRWMTPDPAGLAAVNPANPQSWNRYAYVMNNPLGVVDPTGLCGFDAMTDEGGFAVCVDAQYGADYSGTPPSGPPNGGSPLFAGACTPSTSGKNQATNCGYKFGDSQKTLPSWYTQMAAKDPCAGITNSTAGLLTMQFVNCTNLPVTAISKITLVKGPSISVPGKGSISLVTGAYGDWGPLFTGFSTLAPTFSPLGPPPSSGNCVAAAKALGAWEKAHHSANPPPALIQALNGCS